MEEIIDVLINKHSDGQYVKYNLKCSIKDFKTLQSLMQNKYKIKDYPGTNSMWKHNPATKETYGTVRFKNFELNVVRSCSYDKSAEFETSNNIDKKFWNSKQ